MGGGGVEGGGWGGGGGSCLRLLQPTRTFLLLFACFTEDKISLRLHLINVFEDDNFSAHAQFGPFEKQ